jgi:hypothetical protein
VACEGSGSDEHRIEKDAQSKFNCSGNERHNSPILQCGGSCSLNYRSIKLICLKVPPVIAIDC